MGLRKILTYKDPALHKVCRPVEKFDWRLHKLLNDMADTLAEANGVACYDTFTGFKFMAEKKNAPEGRGLTVELCGVCTDICVVSNALLIKAALPEADLVVDASLCAGVTPQKHEAALETLRSCQIEVK